MLEIKVYINNKLMQKMTLAKNRITIGRSEENDVVLADQWVSRLHAVIQRRGARYYIEDHSSNGTTLDKVRITGSQPMAEECSVGIDPFKLDCSAFSDEVTKPLHDRSQVHEASGPKGTPTESASQNLHFGLLVGQHPSMQRIYKTIQRVSGSSASVMIRGESGTGKELVARAIHTLSPRREAPFVALDCAAIPENLIESELFGYEKGAFTGAASTKKGWIEEAQGGTVFLDEVAELSMPAQAKLLRFLQEKSYSHLGGTRTIQSDVRLITATNKNLEEAIRAGQFRSDLYFRLRVVQIHLPPLRNRKEDIPALIDFMLSKISGEQKLTQRPVLTAQAMEKLQAYQWPGNIRQLENALFNAFINTPAPHLIDDKDIDLQTDLSNSGSKSFDDMNRQLLISTLKECNWDTSRAAAALKVSRGSIYYKCKRLGINIKKLARS